MHYDEIESNIPVQNYLENFEMILRDIHTKLIWIDNGKANKYRELRETSNSIKRMFIEASNEIELYLSQFEE